MNKIRIFIYIFTIVLGLFLVQGAFYFSQSTQANSATITIQTLLRQETSISNTFLISRTLSDLREARMIKCARLIELANKMVHLDMRFKDSCNPSFFLLNGREVRTQLTGLNGELWQIEFQSVNDRFFTISLWLSRVLIVVIFLSTTWLYFNRADKLKSENEKKYKLKNLAEQAAHDVASPLTLMNALISSNHVSNEVKEYLVQVKNSIYNIVGNLREQSDYIENDIPTILEDVNILKIVESLVKEKSVTFKNISFDIPDSMLVKANALELERVISNILNNAIEASSSEKKIHISGTIGRRKVLKIADYGSGIPKHILNKIGTKGVTYGKPHGTGLGLFHAKKSMQSWYGNLKVESVTNEGTTIYLDFKN